MVQPAPLPVEIPPHRSAAPPSHHAHVGEVGVQNLGTTGSTKVHDLDVAITAKVQCSHKRPFGGSPSTRASTCRTNDVSDLQQVSEVLRTQPMRLGNGSRREVATCHVDTLGEGSITGDSVLPPSVRKFQGVGQGGVHEGVG